MFPKTLDLYNLAQNTKSRSYAFLNWYFSPHTVILVILK